MDASCARVMGLARDSISTRLRQKVNANRVKCMGYSLPGLGTRDPGARGRDSEPGIRNLGLGRLGARTGNCERSERGTEYRTIRARGTMAPNLEPFPPPST